MQKDPQEFEKLRRLLALKRHENPPPGYFEGFSDSVISRIEAEASQPSWWQQVVSLFRTNPVASWSLGTAAVAVLLVFSAAPNQNTDSAQSSSAEANNAAAAASMVMATNHAQRSGAIQGPYFVVQSTNAEAQKPSLFATPFYEQAAPVQVTYSP